MAKITELESSDDKKKSSSESSKKTKQQSRSSREQSTGTLHINYVILPIVIVIIGIAVFLTSNQTSDDSAGKTSTSVKKGIILSADELADHDGSDPNVPIYIVILGRVYDVEKGRHHYGPGSGYNVFAGRDSTPSFVTGVFSKELATDDISALSPEEMLGIKDWMDFYRKDYTYVGKVVGRYYDGNGRPTTALKHAKAMIKEGERLKEIQKGQDKRFPPCNSKWSQNEGAEVWCSQNSGGIKRNWEGVPRQFFKPGSKDPKCVCVRSTGLSSDTREGNEGDLNHPSLKLFPGCVKMKTSCKIQS